MEDGFYFSICDFVILLNWILNGKIPDDSPIGECCEDDYFY